MPEESLVRDYGGRLVSREEHAEMIAREVERATGTSGRSDKMTTPDQEDESG